MDYRTIFESDYPGAKAFTQSCLEPVFGPVQKAEHHLNDGLSEADRAIVKDIFIFGVSNNFIFGEMNFFDVTVQDKVDIERNRVTIQRAVRKSLDSYQAAIVIFHHEGNRGLWRFSFIHKGAGTGDATSAKRYSYLCGQGRFCRTLAERFQALEGIAEKKSIEQMATIFSIEALTKDFFTRLFKWYDTWAADTVRFPIGNGKNARLPKTLDESMKKENRRHLIRLITRLVFVWFIKQKIPALDWVFDKDEIKGILAPFDPQSGKEGNYYNGILQNLFFATLNKPINERCFAERDEQARKGDYGIKTKYRDFNAKSLFSDDYDSVPFPLKFKERFDAVPFLNGGLFECLDDFDSKEYRDGFSREKDRAAFVPNCLFWGDGAGASGGREGLLEIFAQYNFTIEENTPQDIEVALDPELLGKVFENLLGTFNEETSATARKESGAFYTPREIVDYMVDASLKEYLKGKLLLGKEKSRQLSLATPRSKACGFSAAPSAGDGILNDAPSAVPDNGVEKKLNTLFDYHEERHSFSADEVSVLIQAINDCKILDPACGSGAFPMGVLHKLTFILGKLDPDNKLWKEKQLEKADSLDDPAIREKVKGEIESAFKNNELGYGRKLFLIENCIYGVDIQPIAIQISKLRFFISLMVDQKIGGTKENNYHVLPLPNLETKFVAANTLIGVKREEHLVLVDSDIENLQNKLLAVRHKHFSVRDAKEKIALRKQDSVLSQCLGNMLKKNRFCNPVDAQKMADWNPYDQNTSSPFFDPWWMFGVNGFDVVLGNPPYVQLQNNHGELADRYKDCNYKTFIRTGDMYQLFYEQGMNVLCQNGCLCFITSNKWMRAGYGEKTRKFLSEKAQTIQLIDFAGQKVFESATVDVNIILIKKAEQSQGETSACIIKEKRINNLTDYVRQARTHVSLPAVPK
jgi:type I restriction-modification system DNA methylase subunit